MKDVKTYEYDAIVVGTGAAGFNAANRIAQNGTKSVAIVTENVNSGTSRNTGSDKQTYYKLSMSGDTQDSIDLMAQNLFDCGAVDGDNALCEAALSARCFSNLCELGVEFPVSRFGQYIGYKTDHDPYKRATSAGPLTSKFMTEALQKKAKELNVPIFDKLYAAQIIKSDSCARENNNNTKRDGNKASDKGTNNECENGSNKSIDKGDGRVIGLLCVDVETGAYVLFKTPNVILATGGPAGIYRDSVYPESQTGSTSLALLSGASLQNFTEWQYGIASVNPRWNVSGSYMQVLPRFVSIDQDGTEHEFLLDYFNDEYQALNCVFLKGYQWPFDSSKVKNGSSIIDILVYRECVLRGREVYLDFTKNPFGLNEICFEKLSEEACNYLNATGAKQKLPIDRLDHINRPAIELYSSKGLDIAKQYLQIALCSQHCNGGIAVDSWWQTKVPGLFAVGECAGTHGVARPGGSALNAGQVGSLRAAQYVCNRYASEANANGACEDETNANDEAAKGTDAKIYTANFDKRAALYIEQLENIKNFVLDNSSITNTEKHIDNLRSLMSDNVSAIRHCDNVSAAHAEIVESLSNFNSNVKISSEKNFVDCLKLYDFLIVSKALCECVVDYYKNVKCSRGSAIYFDKNASHNKGLEDVFKFATYDESANCKVQEFSITEQLKSYIQWRDVRPLPRESDSFENVWARYRKDKNVF